MYPHVNLSDLYFLKVAKVMEAFIKALQLPGLDGGRSPLGSVHILGDFVPPFKAPSVANKVK